MPGPPENEPDVHEDEKLEDRGALPPHPDRSEEDEDVHDEREPRNDVQQQRCFECLEKVASVTSNYVQAAPRILPQHDVGDAGEVIGHVVVKQRTWWRHFMN